MLDTHFITVIIQMNPTENKVQILTFDSLPEILTLTPELLEQMISLLKTKDWVDSFNCITALRSINKFHPQLGPQAVQHFLEHLGAELHNGTPLVVKNAMMLIKQIFAIGRQVNVQNCVVFVPYLLRRSVLQTGYIKTMASQALTQFVLNCGYDASFKVVIESCHDKIPAVSQMSVKVLAKLLQTLGQNIVNLNSETLKFLMMGLFALLDGKRPNIITFANQVCMYMFNTLGSGNFVQLMQFSLQPQQINKMKQIMNEKMSVKTKDPRVTSVRKSMIVSKNKENSQWGNMDYNYC